MACLPPDAGAWYGSLGPTEQHRCRI